MSNGDSLGGGNDRLKTLDIPLLAGYSIRGGSIRLTINGGIIFNLSSWAEGYGQNVFKSNTGLSLYMGLNLEQQVGKRISLFGEPYYRYRLSPMTVSGYPLEKFIDIAGLSFGVRYYFKK